MLTNAAREHVSFDERVLELFHTDAFSVHDIFCRSSRKESREAMIEVDEVLCYATSFGLVGFEDRSRGSALDDTCNFPSKIERYTNKF